MKTVLTYFNKYWWIGLIVLVLVTVSIIGLKFFGGILSFLLVIGILVGIYYVTFGNWSTSIWGLYRIIGIAGTIVCCILLFHFFKGYEFTNLLSLLNDPKTGLMFLVISAMLLISLLFFALGEILVNLHKVNLTNKEIVDSLKLTNTNSPPKKMMICPRCKGKGFVDCDDYKRFGKEVIAGQGWCLYCDAKGEVEQGKTKISDPSVW